MAEYFTEEERLVGLLAGVVERLIHLDYRLRLRSPATLAEKRVWAEVRRDARDALVKHKRWGDGLPWE